MAKRLFAYAGESPEGCILNFDTSAAILHVLVRYLYNGCCIQNPAYNFDIQRTGKMSDHMREFCRGVGHFPLSGGCEKQTATSSVSTGPYLDA